MRTWLYIKALVAFTVVFGAGAISGTVVATKSSQEAQRVPPCTKSLSQRMTAYLVRELKLSDRQIMAIKPFIQSSSDQLGEIHKDALGDASATIEDCHTAIMPFLTEAQVAKLNRCESERQRFLEVECGFESGTDEDCEH